jgi:hypothetical protein
MQHATYYISVGYPKMSYFTAPEAAAITKPDDKPVF